jgi:hypothetical protein
MKQMQRGSALIGVLSVVGLLIAGVVALVMLYVNAANYGNRTEVEIKKVWENNQNILGQYTLKVQEIASVPAMYKDDLKEVMTSVMTARMGTDGSKATFQWFKEHNIQIDAAMYTKIQQAIEAGRNEFQNAQTRLVDVKGTYQTALGQIPQGWFLSMAGYPKIDLEKYRPIVAGDTRKAFEEGVQAPVQLRAKP